MREIKFRAWSASRQTMSESFRLMDLFKMNEIAISDIINDANDPMFLQYAGLVDKNGVEIYEGDILNYPERCNLPHDETKPNHRFWHGVVEFGVNDKGEKWENNPWPSFHVKHLIYKHEVCEVIGNIYENPELLTA